MMTLRTWYTLWTILQVAFCVNSALCKRLRCNTLCGLSPRPKGSTKIAPYFSKNSPVSVGRWGLVLGEKEMGGKAGGSCDFYIFLYKLCFPQKEQTIALFPPNSSRKLGAKALGSSSSQPRKRRPLKRHQSSHFVPALRQAQAGEDSDTKWVFGFFLVPPGVMSVAEFRLSATRGVNSWVNVGKQFLKWILC